MSEELDKAIAEASAAAEKEVSTGTEPEAPETAETQEAAPAEEAEEPKAKERDEHGRFKPKAEAKEEEEEDLGLSAEELALVNSYPKLLKAYKSMQRGVTKKFQSVAEQRKLHEDAVKVASWLQEDPDSAVHKTYSHHDYHFFIHFSHL